MDLPKLDALMNLVGELVLTKGRFQILSDRLREQMGFSVGAAFLRVAVLCVVWVVFGLVIFAAIDRSTRRSGTLSHY